MLRLVLLLDFFSYSIISLILFSFKYEIKEKGIPLNYWLALTLYFVIAFVSFLMLIGKDNYTELKIFLLFSLGFLLVYTAMLTRFHPSFVMTLVPIGEDVIKSLGIPVLFGGIVLIGESLIELILLFFAT